MSRDESPPHPPPRPHRSPREETLPMSMPIPVRQDLAPAGPPESRLQADGGPGVGRFRLVVVAKGGTSLPRLEIDREARAVVARFSLSSRAWKRIETLADMGVRRLAAERVSIGAPPPRPGYPEWIRVEAENREIHARRVVAGLVCERIA